MPTIRSRRPLQTTFFSPRLPAVPARIMAGFPGDSTFVLKFFNVKPPGKRIHLGIDKTKSPK
jgi:hypothetical protein